ncbi:hypothetical protein OPS25_01300 [Alteromonas ponticola]|uniref:Uncharacterized protein n=1 Tax=Alteromonas aquimaris TaxID=2998417 RepID=A0ABT3P2Z9_9ALTE|nr:hypothetical protein [Alteromonas aquimaris]MCW8107139.1 hypothetical protein [Alteromonas aquimaris]
MMKILNIGAMIVSELRIGEKASKTSYWETGRKIDGLDYHLLRTLKDVEVDELSDADLHINSSSLQPSL